MDRFVVYDSYLSRQDGEYYHPYYLRCMIGIKPDLTFRWHAAGCWYEHEKEFALIKEVLLRDEKRYKIITERELIEMHHTLDDQFIEYCFRTSSKVRYKVEFLPTAHSKEFTKKGLIFAVRSFRPDITRSQLKERLNDEKFEVEVTKLKLVITKIDDDTKAADYMKALQIAHKNGVISASMIQRELRTGHRRAEEILKIMEENDVIAPSDGSAGPRKVL